jgi:hypothetical protein
MMERIDILTNESILMCSASFYEDLTVSELYILGICRQYCHVRGVEMVDDREMGWDSRTKPEEMDVV